MWWYHRSSSPTGPLPKNYTPPFPQFPCHPPHVSDRHSLGVRLRIGNVFLGGTSGVLNISWAGTGCWTTTPSTGLWKGSIVALSVGADCDRKPATIRLRPMGGGGDQVSIDSVTVEETRTAAGSAGDAAGSAGEEAIQRRILCRATFGRVWLASDESLEEKCDYDV